MENTEISRQLLTDIIHNARIGQNAVHFLLEKTSNPELQSELRKQERQYLSIAGRAEEKLRAMGTGPEMTSPLAKAGLWMGTQLSTLVDARDMHVSDLMAQGNEMGKLEAERLLERYADAESGALEIASELIHAEEENLIGIEQLSTHQNLT